MPLLALKEEEGDHKPKNVGNSRRWKRQKANSFIELPEMQVALPPH